MIKPPKFSDFYLKCKEKRVTEKNERRDREGGVPVNIFSGRGENEIFTNVSRTEI